MDVARETVHGTAIAAGGRAALIRGASGSGKSDLALRCICQAPVPLIPDTAALVSDDQVVVERIGGKLRVSAPVTIEGRMEVRGLGIVVVPNVSAAELVLVVDLVEPGAYDRFPDTPQRTAFLGVDLPLLRLAAFEISTPLKLLLALRGPAAT